MVANGQVIKFISGKNPEDIDYTKHDINNALLIDNTGAFTTKEDLSRHLNAKGVNKVLLTAPGKEIPNIVYQTWVSKTLPRRLGKQIKKFRELNKDFSFKIFSMSSFKEGIPTPLMLSMILS